MPSCSSWPITDYVIYGDIKEAGMRTHQGKAFSLTSKMISESRLPLFAGGSFITLKPRWIHDHSIESDDSVPKLFCKDQRRCKITSQKLGLESRLEGYSIDHNFVSVLQKTHKHHPSVVCIQEAHVLKLKLIQ